MSEHGQERPDIAEFCHFFPLFFTNSKMELSAKCRKFSNCLPKFSIFFSSKNRKCLIFPLFFTNSKMDFAVKCRKFSNQLPKCSVFLNHKRVNALIFQKKYVFCIAKYSNLLRNKLDKPFLLGLIRPFYYVH